MYEAPVIFQAPADRVSSLCASSPATLPASPLGARSPAAAFRRRPIACIPDIHDAYVAGDAQGVGGRVGLGIRWRWRMMLITRVMDAGGIMGVRPGRGESKYQGDDHIFHFRTLQLKS